MFSHKILILKIKNNTVSVPNKCLTSGDFHCRKDSDFSLKCKKQHNKNLYRHRKMENKTDKNYFEYLE